MMRMSEIIQEDGIKCKGKEASLQKNVTQLKPDIPGSSNECLRFLGRKEGDLRKAYEYDIMGVKSKTNISKEKGNCLMEADNPEVPGRLGTKTFLLNLVPCGSMGT